MRSINQATLTPASGLVAAIGGDWRKALLALLAALAALLGGAAQARSYPPLPDSGARDYQLDAGDEIRVTVFGIDAITNSYIVTDDGTVTLPLAGQITARGRTTTQLQETLAGTLHAKEILVNPNVSVQLTKGRPFYVLGEVKKPGEFTYRPGMNVVTAIAVAGGFTFRANQKTILVTRMVDGQLVTGTVSQATQIRPGDTINVQESWF